MSMSRLVALAASVLVIASLSACTQPYTYASGATDDSGEQSSAASERSNTTGDDASTDSDNSAGTSDASEACQAVVDDTIKAFNALKEEVDNADINTDMLLAKDPNLEVQWEIASENLTKPDLSCDGSVESMQQTVKSAQKLEKSYKDKLIEVKKLISKAEDELSTSTDPSTLPTDDSLESRIAQAKAVLKNTANGGLCNPYDRGRLADVLAASQDMLTSGTASEQDIKAQSYSLHQITEDVRTNKCLARTNE
ncbi:hypothetical protein [Bifidobacterium stellenboschense]|nr:hypothetical protein [Bifidobacterium stellenboschense]